MTKIALPLPEALKRAVASHQAGSLVEAERLYRTVLVAEPSHVETLHLLGVVVHQSGRHNEGIQLIDQALAIKPDYAEALYNRGNALRVLNRQQDALASYDQALAIRPGYAEALSNRGNALLALNREQEALASYDQALAIKPAYAETLCNRGNALLALNRQQDALASYDQALAIKPGYAAALSNRGNALRALNRSQEALESCEQALAIKPAYAEALNNRGSALRALNRPQEALASYDQALAIRPIYAEALSNRGNALRALNREQEALASYDQALAIKPDYAKAHWNESLCRLLIGDFERGWAKYEWRWKNKSTFSSGRFAQPLWLGKQGIAGKTALLHAEQGLGDTIQFCRYAQAVADNGARVVLEVQPPLKSLLAQLRGVQQVLARGEPLPDFDVHCPLLSLPLAFNTSLTTIPAAVPYLSASPDLVKKWQARLGQKGAPRVGIVWSGRSTHKDDHNRSIGLRRLLPLLHLGVRLVSLQKEVRAEDQKILAETKGILHFGSALEDFSDTAALASLMDLVISVDTAAAHLAGALGRRVWILLPFAPDWRWLLEREDSPWYPTARLFRQPKIGDWDSVIHRIVDELSRIDKLSL